MKEDNYQKYLDIFAQINLDDIYIQQLFDYYQKQYEMSMLAQQFVKTSCRVADDSRNHPLIGFCNRTFGKNIPKYKTLEGAAMRGSLQRCGLIRASGHELFRGCILFLTNDDDDNVISATGYRIGRIRVGEKAIFYWEKPAPKAFVDMGMSFAKEMIHGQTYH